MAVGDKKSNTEKVTEALAGSKDVKKDFNKRFGEGTFFTFESSALEIYPISTSIPSVDHASGIGGLPLGRIIEVFGPESSGKTSFCLMTIAEFQRLSKLPGPLFGKKAGFIDAEHALDPLHVRNLNVDVSEETGMLINQPDSGEDAFDLMEAMCLSGAFGIVVVDSAAALTPLAELENDMSYNPIGLQARMLSKGLRKLKGLAHKTNTTFVFINQIREKPGSQGMTIEVTPGGRALRFYSSMRIDVRAKKIEKSGTFYGQETTIKFVKNKCAVPFKTAEYDYYWIGGVDRVKNIMDTATDMDVIHRAGAYFFFGESNKNPFTDSVGNKLSWQGKEALLDALRSSPALYEYTNNMVLGNIPRDAQFIEESPDDEPAPFDDELAREAEASANTMQPLI